MAHPQIEAASLIYNFLVTNPLIMIKLIDLRNKLRDKLDQEILPKMKEYRLWQSQAEKSANYISNRANTDNSGPRVASWNKIGLLLEW